MFCRSSSRALRSAWSRSAWAWALFSSSTWRLEVVEASFRAFSVWIRFWEASGSSEEGDDQPGQGQDGAADQAERAGAQGGGHGAPLRDWARGGGSSGPGHAAARAASERPARRATSGGGAGGTWAAARRGAPAARSPGLAWGLGRRRPARLGTGSRLPAGRVRARPGAGGRTWAGARRAAGWRRRPGCSRSPPRPPGAPPSRSRITCSKKGFFCRDSTKSASASRERASPLILSWTFRSEPAVALERT